MEDFNSDDSLEIDTRRDENDEENNFNAISTDKARPASQVVFFLMGIEVFCLCLMPETYDDMVECESLGNGIT